MEILSNFIKSWLGFMALASVVAVTLGVIASGVIFIDSKVEKEWVKIVLSFLWFSFVFSVIITLLSLI